MTEYTVKEIGHQRIVYADRQSIGACADEVSALNLIAEHSAANRATRRSTAQGIRASKQNPAAGTRGLGHPAIPLIASGLKPIAKASLATPFADTSKIKPQKEPK